MSKPDLSGILDTAASHVPSHAGLPDLSDLPPSPPSTPATAPSLPPDAGEGLSVAFTHLDTALTHTDVTLPSFPPHDFVFQ